MPHLALTQERTAQDRRTSEGGVARSPGRSIHVRNDLTLRNADDRAGSRDWLDAGAQDDETHATREWLVTNGLGGYASGTVGGVITRRYHGLLIAALPSPHGRIVMLSHVAEQLRYATDAETRSAE